MYLTKFGRNAVLYAIGTVGLRTASFLLIPVYTYTLALNDYGLLAVLLQTAQIMVIVMSLGSRTALVRFAKEYEDKNQIGALLGTSILISLAGAAIVTVITTFLLLPLFRGVLHTQNVFFYVLLTCIGAAFNCLSAHLISYYRAGQDGLKVTFVSLLGAVSLIALTMILLRWFHLGIYGALMAQAIIYGALTASLLVMVSGKARLRFSKPLARRLVRFGLPVIPVMAGGLITHASALFFISYFRGLDEAGIYSLGLKIAQIAEMVLILPFEMAYGPFVYGNIGDSRLWAAISRLLTYLMIAFAFVAFGIVFVARDLLPVIAPPSYAAAYSVIFFILPALAFRGVFYIGESLLFLEEKSHLLGSVVTTFSVASVALNYFLIWRWGMYGAIAVFVLTTVGAGAAALKLGLMTSLVRIEVERLCVAAVLLFGFLTPVWALSGASSYVYYSVVPAAVCVGTLLLYASTFFKEDERRAIQEFFGRAHGFRSVHDV